MATRELKSFKHYPADLASVEFERSKTQLYRVTTINWTYPTSAKKSARYNKSTVTARGTRWVDYTRSHKNVYVFTLPKLIAFIRETAEVAEDIIEIKKELVLPWLTGSPKGEADLVGGVRGEKSDA